MPRTNLRTLGRFFLGGVAALAALLPAEKASALSPYLVVPTPAVAEASAAYRYANMTDTEAFAELDKRKVPYKKTDPIAGVVSPVRLTGKLHGVAFHSAIPEAQRATSVYEVLDARLALALDDFAKILERHDIDEVVHYSLYRPNVSRQDHDVHEDSVRTASGDRARPAMPVAAKPTPAGSSGSSTTTNVGAKSTSPAVASLPGKPLPSAATKALPSAVTKPLPPATTKALPSLPGKALPAAPAKALPSLPAKAHPVTHGAKQKDPAASDKSQFESNVSPFETGQLNLTRSFVAQSIAPARRAPASKPAVKPLSAHPKAPSVSSPTQRSAGQATPSAQGRPASPRAAATAQKVGAVTRSRAATATRVEATKELPAAPAAKAPAAPATRQTWAAPGTRHPAGLAIDVGRMKKRDGQWVSVASNFLGKIGAKTCGDGVRNGDSPEARELRSIVCEANDLGVFTYVLTPNYNAAHADHFHMEIRPQVKWFLYQ